MTQMKSFEAENFTNFFRVGSVGANVGDVSLAGHLVKALVVGNGVLHLHLKLNLNLIKKNKNIFCAAKTRNCSLQSDTKFTIIFFSFFINS